jgi:hypothetical protein
VVDSGEKNENADEDTAIACGVLVRKVGWYCGECLVAIWAVVVEIEGVVGVGVEVR